tara:strand:- start:8255 stop:8752 length:498 start_codon:yes stop_codon:yes gene_type:complete
MDPKSKQEIDAVAALIGSTTASLKHVDQQIIDQSANLRATSQSWNPNAVLKEHIVGGGNDPQVPGAMPMQGDIAPPPQYVEPQIQQPDIQQPVMHQPAMHQPAMQQIPGDVSEKLDRVEKKLDLLLGDVSYLKTLNSQIEKSISRGLTGKMKQITIKLDASDNNK